MWGPEIPVRIATMKKQGFAVTVLALLVLLSMTAMAATGRFDQQIQQAVSAKIHDAKQLQNVSSSVEDGIVTLTGTVNLYQDKLDAAKKVKKLANVTGVRNQIAVAGETVPDGQLQQKLAKKLAYDRVGYYDNAFNYLALKVKDGVVTLTGDTMTRCGPRLGARHRAAHAGRQRCRERGAGAAGVELRRRCPDPHRACDLP